MATGVVVSAVGLLVIGSIEARASSPEVEASTINQKGALCSQQTDYADALEHFQKAIALDPTNDKYLSNAASASWWLGELTKAGEYFKKAVSTALDAGAKDRAGQYNHHLKMMTYVLPRWATDKRQQASQLPPTPELQQAMAHFGQLYGQATAALQQGRYWDGLEPARQSVALAEEHFGADNPSTFAAINQLADLYRFSGSYEKARPLYVDIHTRSKKVLGRKHPDTLVYLNNLASVEEAQDKHAVARPLYERIYGVAQKSLGAKNSVTLTYLGNLALNYLHLKRYKAALPLAEKVLARTEALLGETHPDTLVAMNNLAHLQGEMTDYPKAQSVAERATRLALRVLGWQHPITQDIWQNLVQVEASMENISCESLPSLSIDLAARFLDESDPQLLAVMNDLGQSYKNDGEYAKAEPLLVHSLKRIRETFGPEHLQTVVASTNLADLYLQQSRYPEAEPLFKSALALSRKLSGAEDPSTITAMGNLALLYERMGNYAQASTLAEKAATQSAKVQGEEHPDTLGFLNNLALIQNTMGEAHRARPIYEKVLATRQRVLSENHPETLRSMHNLGLLYHSQGLYDRAENLLKKAWRLRKAQLGQRHPHALLSMNGLALLHASRGAYAESQVLYEGVLELRKAALGRDHRDTLISMNDLAALYLRQSLFKKAQPLLEEALRRRKKVLGANHPDTLSSMSDLGTALRGQGRLRKALTLYQEAVRRGTSTYGDHYPNLLSPLNQLALLHDLMGRRDLAQPLFEQALALCTEVHGAKHPDTLNIMGNLATFYDEQGESERARKMAEEVLRERLDVLGDTHPQTLMAINNLALHHQSLGEWQAAAVHWRNSLRKTNHFLDQILWGADEETRQAYLDAEHYISSNLLSFFHQRANQDKDDAASEVLYYSLSRKGLLLKIASEVNALARASDTPALRDAAAQLKEARQELAQLSLRGRGQQSAERFGSYISGLRETVGKLVASLGRSVAQLRRARRQVTPKEVKNALSEDQALVDFVIFDEVDLNTLHPTGEHLMAVVTRRSGLNLVSLGPLKPLTESIAALRKVLKEPTQLAKLHTISRRLHEQLWEPLTSSLGSADTVYLVPDGVLHLLPFSVLLAPDEHYLLASKRLIMLASARDLLVPTAKGKADVAAIFAAPNYDFPSDAIVKGSAKTRGANLADVRFSPLPGTAKDAKAISTLLRRASQPLRLVSGNQATEAALKQIESPRLLHLATHGFFLDSHKAPDAKAGRRGLVTNAERPRPTGTDLIRNPLTRSGLALAGANPGRQGKNLPGGDDGILTAMEVLGLDLVGTELVVLSACETGVGKVRHGEGVYGLQRAFLEAGAGAVLSTLWSIDDDATQDLMTRFYTEFLATGAPQNALRRVQLDMLASERWQHPFYWAPFVMTAVK